MKVNINNLPAVFEKMSLNGTFMIVGSTLLIISTMTQYESGMKLGVVTLVFGAFYRVQLHINRALPANPKYHSKQRVFWVNILKFCLWVVTLSLYVLAVHRIVFNFF